MVSIYLWRLPQPSLSLCIHIHSLMRTHGVMVSLCACIVAYFMGMCVTTVTVSVFCVYLLSCSFNFLCCCFFVLLFVLAWPLFGWLGLPGWFGWHAFLPSWLFLFCSFYCLFLLTVPFTVSFHCFLYCFFIHCFSYCSFFTVPFPFLLLFPKTVLKKKLYCSFLLRLCRRARNAHVAAWYLVHTLQHSG